MKVCTDACVFGASVVLPVGNIRVLDIGSGTGLLSLMLAQRYPQAQIIGVEIDPVAASQAQENVKNSPFASRIEIVSTAIQDFRPDYFFDVIVTNPPFFQSDLRSPDSAINGAHHAQSLSFSDLLMAIKRLLKPGGNWQILLPEKESKLLYNNALEIDWALTEKLTLRHTAAHAPGCIISTFVSNAGPDFAVKASELCFYEPDGKTYTVAFRKLLQEFYLIF
ncbi:methyltransferase domain-containing protein [Arundinibacter roseus]|uniref:Methyltransferase domain-containing protein n=2 Tax=Arundinibacter roseus TaxID=2070510 RepID=A0A4R4KCD6_9BACT|nr:methyltransferase domain-containing protein [Arundinibacter roseus]